MKTVYIFRHGKSDWDAEFSEDHERPVAKRGRKAAQKVGRFLVELGQVPDVVLSSSATARAADGRAGDERRQLEVPLECTWELYAATVPATLKILQSQSDDIDSVMLVGHQPTWSELVANLTGGSRLRFPTAALARIDFAVSVWEEIESGDGELIWFVIPKIFRPDGSIATED